MSTVANIGGVCEMDTRKKGKRKRRKIRGRWMSL
jgi:hypothetical protein